MAALNQASAPHSSGRLVPSVEEPGYRLILQRAWPIVLANAASPLLGLSDTAVLGHVGSVTDLSAVALGTLVFNFAYWGFGFLRMGTTGFVAQADGSNDEPEVRATLGRALVFGVAIGCVLFALARPLARLALDVLGGSPAVEAVTREYLFGRIWGAPAALASFALMGTLIGLGESRALLAVQVSMNVLNVALDVLFAGVWHLGARGVALGTAVTEWSSAVLALVLVLRLLKRRHADGEPFVPHARLKDVGRLLQTLGAHGDIMLRTLLLLLGFGWFTQQGARFGDTTLAANHVLLQFISFSAFFLDGYAFVAEALVGSALGARSLAVFDAAVRRSSALALGTALTLAALWALGGRGAIGLLTDLPSVREAAVAYLPYATTYIALSVAAFQRDARQGHAKRLLRLRCNVRWPWHAALPDPREPGALARVHLLRRRPGLVPRRVLPAPEASPHELTCPELALSPAAPSFAEERRRSARRASSPLSGAADGSA